MRTAIAYVRHPRRGALAVGGAVGFWAANIGVLWASFEAFGGDVPFAVLVQGFFVGMAANLIPSPAGGVGSVDAGMIGAFVLFGIDERHRVPGGAHIPGDRLLAADPARHRRVLPAARHVRLSGRRGIAQGAILQKVK